MKRLFISLIAVLGLVLGVAATATTLTPMAAKAADALTITVEKSALRIHGDYARQVASITIRVCGLNPGDTFGPNGNAWLAGTLTQDKSSGKFFVQGSGYGWSDPVPQGQDCAGVSLPVVTVQSWENDGAYKLGPASLNGYVSRSDGLYQNFRARVILVPEHPVHHAA